MDEAPEVTLSNKELLKLILREKGIHKGHWIFLVHFGFQGMNIGQTDKGEDAVPAGIVSVQKVGIQEVPQSLPFSMDASIVNPAPKKIKKPA